MISDARLQHLMSPDYANSQAGQLAAELYAARQALKMLKQERDEAERLENLAHERVETLIAALLKYAVHKPACASGNVVDPGTLYNKICDCGLSAVATLMEEAEC